VNFNLIRFNFTNIFVVVVVVVVVVVTIYDSLIEASANDNDIQYRMPVPEKLSIK